MCVLTVCCDTILAVLLNVTSHRSSVSNKSSVSDFSVHCYDLFLWLLFFIYYAGVLCVNCMPWLLGEADFNCISMYFCVAGCW